MSSLGGNSFAKERSEVDFVGLPSPFMPEMQATLFMIERETIIKILYILQVRRDKKTEERDLLLIVFPFSSCHLSGIVKFSFGNVAFSCF